ncbi:MAG: GNAT family N-acetyltransferase [Chitinophagaceae bacterium]
MRPALTIYPGQHKDLPEMQQLFAETIMYVCRNEYTPRQTEVWASGAEDKSRWNDIIEKQFVLLARLDSRLVGFASLEHENHIDLLYIHKDHQRQGLALALYSRLESEAIRLGQKMLTADVSITAVPFFKRIGFQILREKTAILQGVELTNYIMEKNLV